MMTYIEALHTGSLVFTLLFLFILSWGLRRKKTKFSSAQPRVSVLIAARNEAQNLPFCAQSLAGQDYPAERSEFIIIDDASTDTTAQVAASWAQRDPRFRWLTLPETEAPFALGPKKRALTAGLQMSRGDLILILDADCTVTPTWISSLVRYFTDEVQAVCGRVVFTNGLDRKAAAARGSWWLRLSQFEGLVNTILNASIINLGGALSCAGANFAYRREAFLAVGGFDAGVRSFSGDDDLLLQRLKRRSFNLRFCPDLEAVVTTLGPDSGAAYGSRKRRHLSAGKRYAVHWVVLAAIIYLAASSTVLMGILRVGGVHFGNLFLWSWGILSLFLLWIFWRGMRYLNERGWWIWALTAAILFPLYFTCLHPLTLFRAPSWKGRK